MLDKVLNIPRQNIMNCPKITNLELLTEPLKAIWKDVYFLVMLGWLLTLVF